MNVEKGTWDRSFLGFFEVSSRIQTLYQGLVSLVIRIFNGYHLHDLLLPPSILLVYMLGGYMPLDMRNCLIMSPFAIAKYRCHFRLSMKPIPASSGKKNI